jgi:hypothetical protein
MFTRRRFIVAGVAGGVALTAAYWLQRTRPGGAPQPLSQVALDPNASAIVAAIVPALLGNALPDDPAERSAAIDETVGNVALAIKGLSPWAQAELSELFSLLAFAPARIALARLPSPWERAGPVQVEAFLERWRTSGWKLMRSAYNALHQLVYAAWYGNPRSWGAIGYDGPPALAS